MEYVDRRDGFFKMGGIYIFDSLINVYRQLVQWLNQNIIVVAYSRIGRFSLIRRRSFCMDNSVLWGNLVVPKSN